MQALVIAVLAVVAGTTAASYVGNTGSIGLDAVFPAVLLALVMPALADRATRQAAAAGTVLSQNSPGGTVEPTGSLTLSSVLVTATVAERYGSECIEVSQS